MDVGDAVPELKVYGGAESMELLVQCLPDILSTLVAVLAKELVVFDDSCGSHC